MAVITFITSLFAGVFKMEPLFKNEYTIPEETKPYTRIDLTPKTDWTAQYIWDSSDGSEENVWMCLRKSAVFSSLPDSLIAYISADSKYWLSINGENVVFEGSLKRGPVPDGSYYDSVDIAPYLRQGADGNAVSY